MNLFLLLIGRPDQVKATTFFRVLWSMKSFPSIFGIRRHPLSIAVRRAADGCGWEAKISDVEWCEKLNLFLVSQRAFFLFEELFTSTAFAYDNWLVRNLFESFRACFVKIRNSLAFYTLENF